MYTVLIADDEEVILTGLMEFVPWEQYGFNVVKTCDNGQAVLDYIKDNHVDFILTDIRMLHATGLDIAKYVYENKLNTIVCLLSGYRDFEYARKAIKYNVNYYLTKPTDFNEFNNVLAQIKETLDNSQSSEKDVSILRERFFIELLLGKLTDMDETDKMSRELNFNPDKIFICPFRISINDLDQFLKIKWNHGSELIFNAILNFIHDSMRDFSVFTITKTNDYGIFIAVKNSGNLITDDDMSDILNEIRTNIYNNMELSIDYYCGSVFTDLSDFIKYYTETIYDKDGNMIPSNRNMLLDIKSSSEMIVNQAREYIDKNYTLNISLDDVARHVFLNSSYLARLFKQYTNENFRDYLIKVRINKAIELIEQKEYKIYEISEMCGYSNPKYFTQQFKQVTGLSPTEYLIRKDNKDD